MTKYLVIALLSVSFLSLAHDLTYDSYLKLQESLAKDNFESAQKAWLTICKKEVGHYAKDYSFKDCDKSIKSIQELRAAFKTLSEIYIKNGKTIENGEVVVAKCPMANARWLQKKGRIQNPYYGASMLECGEFEK